MDIEWTLDLPTDENSRDYQYESPIFVKNGEVYFISGHRGMVLHVTDGKTGAEKARHELAWRSVLPQNCFFAEYGGKVIVYTGELWVYENGGLSKLCGMDICDEINSYIFKENYFYFADSAYLCCVDLDKDAVKWSLDISGTHPYTAGEICFFEGEIACYGRGALLFVDPASGEIKNSVKIPRVSKLFSPVRLDERHLLLGYTNWSCAGILKYDTETKKAVWRSKRSFEGPLLRCKIYLLGGLAFWVKNDTELVCVSAEDGAEVYSVKTEPWLYTDLLPRGGSIIYGTAGRDGFFVSLDAASGNKNYEIALKNGCAYYDFCGETVLLGDFEKTMYQIDAENGKILQKFHVDGEVVGQVTVCGNCVYTVIWGYDETPIRLVKIRI